MNPEQNKPELTPEEREARRQRRWERHRAWQSSRMSLLTLLILVPVYFLIVAFLLVFPRSTVSQIENRMLATFPKFSFGSYFSGDFTADIAEFYDDTVPYRDSFKRMGTQITGVLGLRNSKDTITLIQTDIVAENMNGGNVDEEVPEETKTVLEGAAGRKPTDTTVPEETQASGKDYTAEDAEYENSNGLLIVNQDDHWKVLPLFGGGSGAKYIEALNTLQEKVGDDVTIYSMPIPLSSEFYLPSNAAGASASHVDCFNKIAEQLDSRIVSVDVIPALGAHTQEAIYCRTDHHWQPLGAYYACEVFAKAAGVPYAALDDYLAGKNEGYVGTMYAYTNDSRILNDPEDFCYYTPLCEYEADYYDSSFHYSHSGDLFVEVSVANSYLMFMGSDTYVAKVTTGVDNGRKLLVVKDSYGNATIPFFTSSFEEIYVVDMRYFERNLPNFIDAMGVTDVLFTMCSYSVVGGNANNLMNLITQDASSTIVDTHAVETTVPPSTEATEVPEN